MQPNDEVYEREFKVAGVSFYQDNIEKVSDLAPTPSLERDPTNKHDLRDDGSGVSNAIKVLMDGLQVGFVPAYMAKTMSKKMDEGAELTVELIDWNTAPHHKTIGIILNVKEN